MIINLRTLDLYTIDLPNNLRSKYRGIRRLLIEFDIMNVTIEDIKAFIKRELGEDVSIDKEKILSFIADEKNREKLIRFGQAKNPIKTKHNDEQYRISKIIEEGDILEL